MNYERRSESRESRKHCASSFCLFKRPCSLFNFSWRISWESHLLPFFLSFSDNKSSWLYSRWNSVPEILQIHNLLVTAPNDLWMKKTRQRKIKWNETSLQRINSLPFTRAITTSSYFYLIFESFRQIRNQYI